MGYASSWQLQLPPVVVVLGHGPANRLNTVFYWLMNSEISSIGSNNTVVDHLNCYFSIYVQFWSSRPTGSNSLSGPRAVNKRRLLIKLVVIECYFEHLTHQNIRIFIDVLYLSSDCIAHPTFCWHPWHRLGGLTEEYRGFEFPKKKIT